MVLKANRNGASARFGVFSMLHSASVNVSHSALWRSAINLIFATVCCWWYSSTLHHLRCITFWFLQSHDEVKKKKNLILFIEEKTTEGIKRKEKKIGNCSNLSAFSNLSLKLLNYIFQLIYLCSKIDSHIIWVVCQNMFG